MLEKAAETAKVEQYWILADKSEPRVPPKNFKYVEELAHLQIELIKMQEWVKYNRLRVCVIFEGRDAAGKGGAIKRITDHSTPASAASSRFQRRLRRSAGSGISNAMSRSCPRWVRSCCSTAVV